MKLSLCKLFFTLIIFSIIFENLTYSFGLGFTLRIEYLLPFIALYLLFTKEKLFDSTYKSYYGLVIIILYSLFQIIVEKILLHRGLPTIENQSDNYYLYVLLYKYIVIVSLLVVMKYLFKDKSVSIDYFLKCFILLGSLISIVVFIEYVLHLYPLSIDVKLAKKQSIDAGFGNSNNVAYFLFMCFCSGMYLLIYAKKKIFSILAIVFIVLAIYICASRTIYLSIVIIGFLYFIFLFDRNIISKLFYVIIFLLSVIIFYNLALSLFGHDLNSTLSNTNNYLLHKQHDVLDSNLGARKDIYINYLKIFFESFFMGVGPGFAYYYFPLGSVFDPHSIILGVMAESGLPGIILIAVFFYNRFIQVKKSNAADKFILLMLFVVIFIAGNTPSKAYFMFPLWFFIISINELLLINKDKA